MAPEKIRDCAGRIRLLLTELRLLPPDSQIGDSNSLFDASVLDSLRLMELVPPLEQRFGIRVDIEDLTPDNFDSLETIAGFVVRKTGAADAR